jgi:hypothetical protein
MQIFVYMDIPPAFSNQPVKGCICKDGNPGVYTNICIFVYMNSLTDKCDLKPNQAVCFNCGNLLTSNDQYNMVTCSCCAMAVDGGKHLRVIELKENTSRTGGLPPDDNGFTVKINLD